MVAVLLHRNGNHN